MRPVGQELESRLEEAAGLDGLGAGLGALARAVAPDGSARKELLAGTWLGHPLHPLLTDVVIGAWTSAVLLDLGGEDLHDAADAFVALGIAAAVPTALSGLSDWADTQGPARRVGLVHAAGNTAALGLFAASLAARRTGSRGRGVALSGLGAAVATAAGWLGGHLAYRHGIGVDRTAFDGDEESWVDVGLEAPLPEGTMRRVEAGATPVLLVRAGGRLHAMHDRCSHRGCSLAEGELEGETVVCPCHGSAFALDGSVVRGPATAPQPALEVRSDDGRVRVRPASVR